MPVTVFGGGAVQTAYVSFTRLDITDNSITLVWPTSYFDVPSVVDGIHYNVLAASMLVTDGIGNTNTITLPNATESSVGSNFIITNVGASAFQLLTSNGSELILIPNEPDTANSFWVQLIDNSTPEGGWAFVQFGAGTSQAQASALAGNGLVALLGLLNTNIVVESISSSPYDVIVSDRAKLLLWQTGEGNINLPDISSIPAGFYISVNNEGTGILTIMGDVNIDNNPTITVAPSQSLSIISDGSHWWTLGFGQNIASSNFISGSAIDPSITFIADTETGIYYYQTVFPPVTPPGIGFTVHSSPVANITASGLYINAGKTITVQDSTNVSTAILSSNASEGVLSFNNPSLSSPATLNISGTNTDTTLSLGPFLGLSITEGPTTANISYNDNINIEMDNAGNVEFPFDIHVIGNSTFDGPADFNDTVTLSTPLSIPNGGTGQTTQQAALNALMPTGAAIGDIVYFNAAGNWVRLPIGVFGQTLTVGNVGGNLVPVWA